MCNKFIDKNGSIKIRNSRRKQLENRFISMDMEKRQMDRLTKEAKPGPKNIILDAYNKNGKNGAMLALKMLNKRLNVEVYSWKDVESWIEEYEKENSGGEICD